MAEKEIFEKGSAIWSMRRNVSFLFYIPTWLGQVWWL
jgi:hypothetical protein